MTNKRRKLFSEEEERFVEENVRGIKNKELTEMVNHKFGTKYTIQQVKSLKARRKWSSGLTGHFEKGGRPWNAGMKGLVIEGSQKGWFEKGQEPLNYRPVGSERKCPKDGYVLVKVEDKGSYQERWRHKHVVIWEKENGKVPENHVVIFLDGDKTNIRLENLKMISRRDLVRLNQSSLPKNDPETTKSSINLVRLQQAINDKELNGGDPERYKKYKEIAEKNGIQEQTFIGRVRRGWTLHDATYQPLHARPYSKKRRNKQ